MAIFPKRRTAASLQHGAFTRNRHREERSDVAIQSRQAFYVLLDRHALASFGLAMTATAPSKRAML
jgi:hypothetical protein